MTTRRPPQFVRRVNLLLTPTQMAGLLTRAAVEGRTVPNLVRRILDQAIVEHDRTTTPRRKTGVGRV